MSRSSGPNGQVRGVAPQQWQQHPEPDPAVQQAFAAVQAAAQARYQQQAAQPPQHPTFGNVQPSDPRAGYGAPQGQYQQPQMPSAPPAYRPPTPPDPGFYGAPTAPPQPQQQSYQPVFERYAPPQPAAHQQGYDPRTAPPQPQAYAPPPAQRAPAEPPQPSPYDSHFQQRQDRAPPADLRGGVFDKWPPQNSHQQPAPPPAPAPAARGYDFASYGTPAAADFGRTPQGGHQHQQPAGDYRAAAAQADPRADGQWQLGSPYDQDDQQAAGQYAAAGQPGVEDGGYPGDATGQLQPATEHDFDPDDHPDYEDDEPRRGRKGLIMVSALVGAIALGGGLAFAYKRFVKPGTVTTAQVSKVSAPTGPSKTQPADRGGKQFPNQDSKLQSRLGDGTAQPAAPASAAPAADVEGGVKRVPTVVIGRDGSVSAPAASAVPGMVVVQPAAPPAPPPAAAATVAAATASAPPTAAAAVPVPPQPRVAAVVPQAPRAPVAMVNAAPTAPEPAAAPPPPAPKKTVRKAAAPRDDLAAATAAGTATAATTTAAAPQAAAPRRTSGYVAVLASKGSKAEAERANSEFEQRFDVLKGKVFDVQEANLTNQGKGIYYRSVVGPPGSREYASGVCTQLKAAGYTGCWITAY